MWTWGWLLLLHADGARLNNTVRIRKRMINTWLEVHDSNRSESHLLKVIYVFLLSRVWGSLHMLYGDLLSMVVWKILFALRGLWCNSFSSHHLWNQDLTILSRIFLLWLASPMTVSDSWRSHPVKKTPKTSKIKFNPSFCSIVNKNLSKTILVEVKLMLPITIKYNVSIFHHTWYNTNYFEKRYCDV
jgi:hypothetical protein